MLYNKFSDYLKSKYGAKVYKLPINLPVTCPNRDGTISFKGCAFCGEEGAGFETLSSSFSVAEQLDKNIEYIGKNYNAKKFIAYFQNYSNTYIELDKFKQYVYDCLRDNIVAIYISTRPDCVSEVYLDFLSRIKLERNIDILIELGLQTVNYHTLKILKRGHGLAEFIDATSRIKRFDLQVCAHYIVDLPMDNIDDVSEGARVLSALGVDQVKCHSLYILRDTEFGEMYTRCEIIPLSMDEYIERAITFLEYLNPEVVIQRLIGRAPKEKSIFCNWDASWWRIQDMIERKMMQEGRYQGGKFNYLNGTQNMNKFI